MDYKIIDCFVEKVDFLRKFAKRKHMKENTKN